MEDWAIGISDVSVSIESQEACAKIADANSAAAEELMVLVASGAELTATVTHI